MNSSKSMVQAVTLLTALRMFTNGKFANATLINDDVMMNDHILDFVNEIFVVIK